MHAPTAWVGMGHGGKVKGKVLKVNGGGAGGRPAWRGARATAPRPSGRSSRGVEVVVVGAGMVAVPAAAAPGTGPRGRAPCPALGV